MNIYRLNQKMRIIMEVHDIINRDNLKAIQNSYIGIHQDYLFHQVAKFTNLNLNYEQLRQEFQNFFKKFKDNNIQPLVVLGQFTSHNLNPQLVIQTCIKKNQAQFRELLYNEALIEALLPKKILIQWLKAMEIQYIIVPSVGAQLRYLFTNGMISGILGEISFLEHCFGFKELNHLIINIIDETFEWIDIKILTAKSQLSLDSLSELFSLYDYCTVNDVTCYNETILNQTSQQRLDKPFNQLKRKEQSDILYNIGQQFFAGKLSFSQRIQKFQANLIDSHKISGFIQAIKEQVYIDLNFDQQRVSIVPSGWIQYPTELLLFQYYGYCLQTKQPTLIPSYEVSEIEFIDPQHIIFEKLNIGYLQGQNQKRMNIYNGLFKDFVKNASLQRSINYYYKKLKLTSRKSSFEVGVEPNVTNNLELIQLNTSLRFLHLVNLIDLEHEKGSLFASALSYVKPENFVPFFIYLKLIESPLKNILYEQFYSYSQEIDGEIQSNLKEKYDGIVKTCIDQLDETTQERDNRIILLLRFFILNSKSKIHKFNQFSDLVSKISMNYAEVYEAILFSLYLDLNQKNTINYFLSIGAENPFIRQFNYDETFYLFLQKKISKQEFPNLQQYIDCWADFMKMFEYIHQKKGQRYDELARANEYFQQLIK